MPYYISPPPQNPISRFIAGIVAALAVVGAFMIGMVALLVVAGVGLVAGIAVWLRVLWIKRKLRKNGFDLNSASADQNASSQGHQSHQGQVIDAEYTVVSEQKDRP
jgi:hypothetical protein